MALGLSLCSQLLTFISLNHCMKRKDGALGNDTASFILAVNAQSEQQYIVVYTAGSSIN